MITIFGNVTTSDTKLINQLKKYFEADDVILNWDGEREADPRKNTLAITSKKPPYQAPCSAISIDAVHRLLKS